MGLEAGKVYKMNAEVQAKKSESAQAIRLYIQLILIQAGRKYSSRILSTMGASTTVQALYISFLKLVSQYFVSIRKVSAYADMLHVSPDHLNRSIKACSDKTAHELIEEMILL